MSRDIDFSKMSNKNTWFKVGLNDGVSLNPINSNFVLGLDASLHFLETKATGIVIKSGNSHYLSNKSALKFHGLLCIGFIPNQ